MYEKLSRFPDTAHSGYFFRITTVNAVMYSGLRSMVCAAAVS